MGLTSNDGHVTQNEAGDLWENPAVRLRGWVRAGVERVGEFTQFFFLAAAQLPTLWRRRGLFLRQCEFIGVSSLGVNIVGGVFMGAVLGYQLYTAFERFGAEALVGGSVGVSLYRELGPVLAAFIVTGRAGAAMAAEISSMRISEQIDALEVMAVDPHEFLVTPRIAAGTIMMPAVAMFFCFVASFAASWVACGVMGLDYQIFWKQYLKIVDPIELFHCLVKGAFFGLVFTWVGCFNGFKANGGARAVGAATRNTVVVSFLLILFTDYILTSILPYGFTKLRAS